MSITDIIVCLLCWLIYSFWIALVFCALFQIDLKNEWQNLMWIFGSIFLFGIFVFLIIRKKLKDLE